MLSIETGEYSIHGSFVRLFEVVLRSVRGMFSVNIKDIILFQA